MADEAKEFSREEAQSLMFHGAPQQPMTTPAVQSVSNIPVPPPVAVIPGAKKAPVAKEPDAIGLVQKVSKANKELQGSIEAPKPPSSIGGLVDDITANWKPIAIGALTFATGYGAARLLGGRKSAEVSEGKPQPKGPAARIEPTFATPEETAAFKPVEQPTAPSKLALESEAKFGVPLSDVENHFGVKVTNIKDAEILSNNYKNSLPGAVSNAPAGIPNGVNPMNRLTNPVQPPVAPAVTPPTPSVGETVATGGNVAQAIKQTVANELDAVLPPQGMKPQYKPKKGEIGPGGYNWFASQVGPEEAPARWAEQYGEKNVPYKQVQSEYAATRYPVKPNPEGAKTGGAYGKPEHIPEFIKGGASVGGLLNVAGNALGILGLGQEYKKAKKSGDWSDFGLGLANQLIGNVAPRMAAPLALMTPGTLNADEQQQLAAYRNMAPTIDRAVPPKSRR